MICPRGLSSLLSCMNVSVRRVSVCFMHLYCMQACLPFFSQVFGVNVHPASNYSDFFSNESCQFLGTTSSIGRDESFSSFPHADIVLCPCRHNNTVLPKTLSIAH